MNIEYPNVAELLTPQRHSLDGGAPLLLFPTESTDLVKIDFVRDAGYLHQPQMLCAAACTKLSTVATTAMDARILSRYLDERGAVVDASTALFTSTITLYMHRRNAEELVGVMADMVKSPALQEEDFEVWRGAKQQELLTRRQLTSAQTRRVWYEMLFGPFHPLGRTASVQDLEELTVQALREYHTHLMGGCRGQVVVAGNVDERLRDTVSRCFSPLLPPASEETVPSILTTPTRRRSHPLAEAQQTTLRIGRVIPGQSRECYPDAWAMPTMVASIMGGYFGSRLMSNLREDKGYTYGISAHVQSYRGKRIFFVQADVAAGTAADAVKEVMAELARMGNEPVPQEELERVRNVLAGDTMRALDGVFERADRYGDIVEAGEIDCMKATFADALQSITPDRLCRFASQWFCPDDMAVALAGPPDDCEI